LIELLVGLTITTILAGVAVKGGIMVVHVASNVLIVWEIAQLNDAVQDFAIHFGDYPPDFHDQDSTIQFIQQHFPKCPRKNYPCLAGQSPASALYFWLAGPNGQGFNTDPTNPFSLGGRQRVGPFISFAPNRVKTQGAVSMYYPPQIFNPAPYVYFRAGTKGYLGNCGYPPARPYRDSKTGAWINSDSFQIICAGQDGKFGSGNRFPGGENYDQANLDDISNFSFSGTMAQAKLAASVKSQEKQTDKKQPAKAKPAANKPPEPKPPALPPEQPAAEEPAAGQPAEAPTSERPAEAPAAEQPAEQ
jgi:hypothetical protein